MVNHDGFFIVGVVLTGALIYVVTMAVLPVVIAIVVLAFMFWKRLVLPATRIDLRRRQLIRGMIIGFLAGGLPGGLVGAQDIEINAPLFGLIVGVFGSTIAAAMTTPHLLDERYFQTHRVAARRMTQLLLGRIAFGTTAALIMGRSITLFISFLGGSEQVELLSVQGDVVGTALLSIPVGVIAALIGSNLVWYDNVVDDGIPSRYPTMHIKCTVMIGLISGGSGGLLFGVVSQNILFVVGGFGVGLILGLISGVLSGLLMTLTILRRA
ncbi:MAG: hypothetical protein D6737_12770 [Chloroflexi bacterium]|nr:MAG: hypothetical protein D6737_12770 [Chloroflexota bacterium]